MSIPWLRTAERRLLTDLIASDIRAAIELDLLERPRRKQCLQAETLRLDESSVKKGSGSGSPRRVGQGCRNLTYQACILPADGDFDPNEAFWRLSRTAFGPRGASAIGHPTIPRFRQCFRRSHLQEKRLLNAPLRRQVAAFQMRLEGPGAKRRAGCL